MTAFHFSIALHKKRDVVLARRRARQIASFLGFDEWDTLTIAAATFNLATQIFNRSNSQKIEFQLDEDTLHIRPAPLAELSEVSVLLSPSPPAIRKRLPQNCDPRLAVADVPWILDQLDQGEKSSLWEEIQRQNQELLAVLLQLRRLEQKGGKLPRIPEEFAA